MVATPERLAELSPEAFRGWLHETLQNAYGCWHRAAGTGLTPHEWLTVLAEAVQAEATDEDDAVALSHFALADDIGECRSAWARAALSQPYARTVLLAVDETLTIADAISPQAAQDYLRRIRHRFRDEQELRGRLVMAVIRAALTGDVRGPCLGIVVALLGCDRARARIEECLSCSS